MVSALVSTGLCFGGMPHHLAGQSGNKTKWEQKVGTAESLIQQGFQDFVPTVPTEKQSPRNTARGSQNATPYRYRNSGIGGARSRNGNAVTPGEWKRLHGEVGELAQAA